MEATPNETKNIKTNLDSQLAEIEILESMFGSSELKIEDRNAITEIENFINGKTTNLPPYIDLTLNVVTANDNKLELCVNLQHDYPTNEPEVFVRSSKLNKKKHAELNKDLNQYISTFLKGETCVFSIVLWLQEHGDGYMTKEKVELKKEIVKRNEKLTRLWIYSHHIYSKTKRRNILELAQSYRVNGFCMPGKPGIICVEGALDDCNDWWQEIKSMNWKKIVCRVTEDVKTLRFIDFQEVAFQSNGDRCNHMDIGELHKYLEKKKLGFIFKELFGVEGK